MVQKAIPGPIGVVAGALAANGVLGLEETLTDAIGYTILNAYNLAKSTEEMLNDVSAVISEELDNIWDMTGSAAEDFLDSVEEKTEEFCDGFTDFVSELNLSALDDVDTSGNLPLGFKTASQLEKEFNADIDELLNNPSNDWLGGRETTLSNGTVGFNLQNGDTIQLRPEVYIDIYFVATGEHHIFFHFKNTNYTKSVVRMTILTDF